MANNLFISYDLNSPRQDYDAVISTIQSLGNWAKVHKSLWYVNSNYSAARAAELVWRKMDRNDQLIVIDTTNNNANWYNLSDEVSGHIRQHWQR